MTISTTTTRNDYVGNGATTVFAFTFKALADSWVQTRLAGALLAAGVTVFRNADQDAAPGGTVTFNDAPGVGAAVRLQRSVPLTQETALTAYGPFPAKTVEHTMDRLVMADQQVAAEVADVATGLGAEVARAAAAEAALGASIGVGGGLVHRSAVALENHVLQGWDVADAAARAALVPAATDLGRVARQLDDNSAWLCVGYAPATWSEVAPTSYTAKASGSTGGSVVRSFGDRFADSLSILDFGAGTAKTAAENTAAINAAITAAGSTKRVVGVRGSFAVDGGIVLRDGTRFDGQGMTLVPSKTPDLHLLRGLGTVGAHLKNITVSGLHIVGTNKPTYPADGVFPDGLQGGWGQIRFDYCDDVTVSNVTWDGVHSCLVFQNCQGMAGSNLVGHDLTDGVVTFFTGCKRGVFANIQATNASECMDFFNTEDITITNVQGTGQVTPAHVNEAFDISTSRRISISNVVVTGFARGARIKSEGVGPGSGVAWSDISISNMTCLDQTFDGINAQSSATGYTDGTKRLRLTNITIRSTVAGASGILSAPDINGGDDVRIEGCNIDVPATGIAAYGSTGLVIRGNRVLAQNGRAIDVTATSTHGAVIAGNYAYATGGTSADGAIFVQRSDDVRIVDNIAYSAAGYGIRFTTGTAGGKRPLISRNLVTGAGLYGIYVQWANAAQFDALRAGEISHNDVRDWGLTTSARAGIYVTFSSITATVEGLVISGNTMTLPTAAANTQSGINVIQVSGALTFTRCRIDNNLVGSTVPSTAYTLQGTWTQYNVFAGNQPPLPDHDQVSADRGDAGVSLQVRVDEPVQIFATTLTANRTVTLQTTGAVKGDRFRVVRSGLGAFTLNVGGLKTIPSATAAFVDVAYNGAAWVLTGYGTL